MHLPVVTIIRQVFILFELKPRGEQVRDTEITPTADKWQLKYPAIANDTTMTVVVIRALRISGGRTSSKNGA
jgi:hypothetical protein